ncbi:metal ABC transporter permease [Alistipes sp.]|uniref:metal ABC transporter permease n=1 Tax=Alistipes sp. TaxID=1872444 RepID=UPI003A8C0316
MEFFYAITRYAYLHNALMASLLAGVACGIVGTYVVCRRTVFLAGGITHASFGGLGLAFYLGQNPIVGALAFAVLSALGIEWAGDRGRIREDSAIGIIWSVGMALGVLFMSLRPGYTSGDLANYLFGSIVTVTRADVAALAVLTVLLVAGAALWLRPVMYIAFDREFARSQGIATQRVSYLMAALTAVTIVLAIRVMGIVLLLSLMTVPAVAMNLLTKSFRTITAGAAALGALSGAAGLAISYRWELPSGVAIIFVLTASLIVAKLLSLQTKRVKTRHG